MMWKTKNGTLALSCGCHTAALIVEKHIKVVVVGDTGVGKTCLVISYINNHFPLDYLPAVFDNYVTNLRFHGKIYSLTLWDTWGSDENGNKVSRWLGYAQTDVILICFSVVNPSSYQDVIDKWFPEVHQRCPEAALILIGTKSDLRTDEETIARLKGKNMVPITPQQGQELALHIGAYSYIETSAFKKTGLRETFNEAVRVLLIPPGKRPCPKPFEPRKPPAPNAPRFETIPARLGEHLANAWNRADTFPDVLVLDHGDKVLVHNVFLNCMMPLWKSRVIQQKLMRALTADELTAHSDPSLSRPLSEGFLVNDSLPAGAVRALLCGWYRCDTKALSESSVLKQLAILLAVDKRQITPTTIQKRSFGDYLNRQELSDVSFLCKNDNQPIYAHKCVLVARSERFRAMYSHAMKESKMAQLEVPHARPMFLQMLKFLYTDEHISEDLSDPVALLRLAHEYHLTDLVATLEYWMTKHLSAATVYEYLQAAVTYNAKSLEAQCGHWFIMHHQEICHTKEYEANLTDETRRALADNAYPGKAYWDQLAEYKKRRKKKKSPRRGKVHPDSEVVAEWETNREKADEGCVLQ